MPFDPLIGKALEIPTMMWLTYLANPPQAFCLNLPSQSSYDLPTAAPGTYVVKNFDFDFPLFKFTQILPRHLIPLLIPKLYSDENVNPEFQGDFLTSYDQ